MRKQGLLFWTVFILILLPFFISDSIYEGYLRINASHPYFMSFLKFAILSTAGEIIGFRIKTGVYFQKGFGILPRMVVWGFLGIAIAMAMKIFASGVPAILNTLGVEGVTNAMKEPLSGEKLLGALCISVAMNLIFAPGMMIVHKITDTHIINYGGSIKSLITPIKFGKTLKELDWNVQWNFVFKKTIPLFWIPAHTITFCLPAQFQVLFAASLGIALGVILSIAARMGKD